jgi:transcriptional regulator with XRE-family HTH domain
VTQKSNRDGKNGNAVPRPLRADSPISEFARQVGAAIRAAREAKGMTMSAASAYTGGRIGVSLWSIYEIGATELKLKNALRIARALTIPLELLLPDDLREAARTGTYPAEVAILLDQG